MAGEERRIILLGKTGSGKSSLANTIFGSKIFKSENSPNSVSDVCKSEKKIINGKTFRVFDTPGVLDTDPNNTALGEKLYNCVKGCAPGPHAFVLVLRVDRFTEQEKEVVKETLSYFSKEALKYTTVVFTHGDQLDDGQKIEDWYKKNDALTSLVQKCGGRCHVFDNKYWNKSEDPYRNNTYQTTQLLQTIEHTVEKNRRGSKSESGSESKSESGSGSGSGSASDACYTNDFWQHIKYLRIKGVLLKYLLAGLLGGAVVGFVVGAGLAWYLGAECLGIALSGAGGAAVGAAVGAGGTYAVSSGKAGEVASGSANRGARMLGFMTDCAKKLFNNIFSGKGSTKENMKSKDV